MTARKTHDGYYVTAKYGASEANMQVAYLIGPFSTRRAASMMVSAGRKAANRTDDPRMAFAGFGVTKLTIPVDKALPPGRLDLSLIDPDDVIKL
jgi:hypothetical protein